MVVTSDLYVTVIIDYNITMNQKLFVKLSN